MFNSTARRYQERSGARELKNPILIGGIVSEGLFISGFVLLIQALSSIRAFNSPCLPFQGCIITVSIVFDRSDLYIGLFLLIASAVSFALTLILGGKSATTRSGTNGTEPIPQGETAN